MSDFHQMVMMVRADMPNTNALHTAARNRSHVSWLVDCNTLIPSQTFNQKRSQRRAEGTQEVKTLPLPLQATMCPDRIIASAVLMGIHALTNHPNIPPVAPGHYREVTVPALENNVSQHNPGNYASSKTHFTGFCFRTTCCVFCFPSTIPSSAS